jgi:hypothetical protein
MSGRCGVRRSPRPCGRCHHRLRSLIRQLCERAGQRTIPNGNSPTRRRARIVRAASKDPQTRRTCTGWIEVIERSGCREDSTGTWRCLSGNEARLPSTTGCRRGTTPWRRPTRLLAESARLLRRTRQGSLSQHVARPFFLSWSPWSSNDESRPRGPSVVTWSTIGGSRGWHLASIPLKDQSALHSQRE